MITILKTFRDFGRHRPPESREALRGAGPLPASSEHPPCKCCLRQPQPRRGHCQWTSHRRLRAPGWEQRSWAGPLERTLRPADSQESRGDASSVEMHTRLLQGAPDRPGREVLPSSLISWGTTTHLICARRSVSVSEPTPTHPTPGKMQRTGAGVGRTASWSGPGTQHPFVSGHKKRHA